jgi:hypothetical protein
VCVCVCVCVCVNWDNMQTMKFRNLSGNFWILTSGSRHHFDLIVNHVIVMKDTLGQGSCPNVLLFFLTHKLYLVDEPPWYCQPRFLFLDYSRGGFRNSTQSWFVFCNPKQHKDMGCKSFMIICVSRQYSFSSQSQLEITVRVWFVLILMSLVIEGMTY